jgi:hypothetical protein
MSQTKQCNPTTGFILLRLGTMARLDSVTWWSWIIAMDSGPES